MATAALPRRARMLHYAWWQARDYFFERGVPTVLVSSLFGVLSGMTIRAGLRHLPPAAIRLHGSLEAAQRAFVAEASQQFVRGSLGGVVFLGALFAMNGLVANDRKLGFYRFLFAKPVAPERYYGQAFVVHVIGFLLALTTLALAWGALVHPILSVRLLTGATTMFLCYAGIAFLLGAAARYDWLSLVAVSLLAQTMWEWYGASAHPLAKLLYLLPPLPRADRIYDAVVYRTALPWHTMWWFTGYGIACFVMGLVVLRHRRLAIP